jgi:hypothetical protein
VRNEDNIESIVDALNDAEKVDDYADLARYRRKAKAQRDNWKARAAELAECLKLALRATSLGIKDFDRCAKALEFRIPNAHADGSAASADTVRRDVGNGGAA